MTSSRCAQPAARIRTRGFTIVEMLVVMAVIAALIGMLLAGLQAAQRSSRRTKQLSDLRQVFNGWSQYANTYGDALLPGYMDEGVQSAWRVAYKYKNDDKVPPEYCKTYPWRLLPYLDHSFPTLFEYLEADDDDVYKPKNPDGTPNTTGMAIVADKPAFGYNAYYLGGWWTSSPAVSMAYSNSTWTNANGQSVQGLVVATKLGNIAKPDQMITFCAASYRQPGFYKMESDDWAGGSPWVVPHILADQTIWMPSDGTTFGEMQASLSPARSTTIADLFGVVPILSQSLAQSATAVAGNSGVQVFTAQGVPQRRFGPGVPVVHADGSTVSLGLGQLIDQRRWMNPASNAQAMPNAFTHSQN